MQQIGQDVRKNLTCPYIWISESRTVQGYYTLSCHSVSTRDLPAEIAKKIPYPSVPVVLLGRLAIDQRLEGVGNGGFLLLDALQRSYELSSRIAALGVIVDAIDDEARLWYRKFGFIEFPDSPLRLFILMKTIKAIIPSESATPSVEQPTPISSVNIPETA